MVDDGYQPWCDACDWNVEAPAREQPRGVGSRVYAAAGRRLGDRMTADLSATAQLEPRVTPSVALAVVIAVGVHLLTLALGITALVLMLRVPSNPLALFAGLLCGGLAWIMRPRLGTVPVDNVVSRESAPELHRLVDEVAAAAGGATADLIVVDADVNASWGRAGLRRRRVLQLGLPLWSALSPPARVALVGHEVGHERNGDLGRGLLVSLAWSSLEHLYQALSVNSLETTSDTGLELVVDAVTWVLSRPAWLLLTLQAHLVLHDSQRAEYLADDIAARVAGTEAAVELLGVLLAAPAIDLAVRRHSQANLRATGDLFDEIGAEVSGVPARERERLRRAARSAGARLDETHPPHANRIGLLESRSRRAPLVPIDAVRMAAIDDELAPLRDALATEVVDAHRASLLVA